MQDIQNAAPAFDLASIEANDTALMEVLGLDDEPLTYNGEPVVFEMYGPSSKQYISHTNKAAAKSKSAMYAALRGKPVKEAEDETRKELVEKLVACTASVGKFPLTARDVYSNPRLGYIVDQAAKFIDDWKAFKKPSPKN